MTSIFDTDQFKPLRSRWLRRQQVLSVRRSLYDGTFYAGDGLSGRLGWYVRQKLYQGVKPLYLPLSRAVDVDAGIIPAGWEFPSAEDEPRAKAWQEARDLLFAWSKWQTYGVLYVHYGAMYGVSGLKIADLRERKRAVVSPIDPATFMLVHESIYDDAPALAVVCEQREGANGTQFEYAEVITPDNISTYKDGELFGYDGREVQYKNELGFVPFVEVKHLDSGGELGEATFVKAVPLLNEVNQLASYLADIIAKHSEPQWVVLGAEAGGDMVKSGDNIWFLPAGSKLEPVIAGIDIPGVLEFIREIAANVEKALPETAFDELRKKDQIATATLELQLMELVLKVKRVRPNYDDGLVTGMKMAARAAKSMGISDLNALDDEDLTLDEDRPVLPLDPQTAIQLEMQELALERERTMSSAGEGMMNARLAAESAVRDSANQDRESLRAGNSTRIPGAAPVPA